MILLEPRYSLRRLWRRFCGLFRRHIPAEDLTPIRGESKTYTHAEVKEHWDDHRNQGQGGP